MSSTFHPHYYCANCIFKIAFSYVSDIEVHSKSGPKCLLGPVCFCIATIFSPFTKNCWVELHNSLFAAYLWKVNNSSPLKTNCCWVKPGQVKSGEWAFTAVEVGLSLLLLWKRGQPSEVGPERSHWSIQCRLLLPPASRLRLICIIEGSQFQGLPRSCAA